MPYMTIILLIVAYYFSLTFIDRYVSKMGTLKSIQSYRVKYILKTLKIIFSVVFIFISIFILGIEYSQISVFISSVFAVVGIAFFAQWSILSNITASLIIFFSFPYRVGDTVKIVSKDEHVSGTIEEISLFHVILKSGNDLITYPNNLILQKAVIKLGDQSQVENDTH